MRERGQELRGRIVLPRCYRVRIQAGSLHGLILPFWTKVYICIKFYDPSPDSTFSPDPACFTQSYMIVLIPTLST